MPWTVHYAPQTGSTNTDLMAMARAGAPAGTVLRAGYQTAGRGRLGRRWVAPPGGSLLASILLEPPAGEPPSWRQTAAVAIAARSACEDRAGVRPDLKWPNDLLVGGRKLAGVLAEADPSVGERGAVVVGIGLNCRWAGLDVPDEVRAVGTALDHAGGRPVEPAELLDALLGHLDTVLTWPVEQLLATFRAGCVTLGADVAVDQGGAGTVAGRAVDVTGDGALVVERPDGTTATVVAGDIL